MPVNDVTAAAAQDNTDAAATETKQAVPPPAENTGSAPEAKTDVRNNPEGDKTAKASAKEMPRSLMAEIADPKQEVAESGEGKPSDASADDYALSFPEDSVPDAESVAMLNSIGKEFGIPQEKAQALATAATEYGNRRVEAVMDNFRSGYESFVSENKAAAEAMYGDKLQENLQESMRGWKAFENSWKGADGKPVFSIEAIMKDPNTQALGSMPFFIEAGRRLADYMTEQPGVKGGKTGDVPVTGDIDFSMPRYS